MRTEMLHESYSHWEPQPPIADQWGSTQNLKPVLTSYLGQHRVPSRLPNPHYHVSAIWDFPNYHDTTTQRFTFMDGCL